MEDALETYEDRWGNETPAHQVFDHLRDLIKTCAQPSSQSKKNATFQPKQRWFDAACQRARQKSMRLLNMARGCGASVFKNLYLRAVGDFKVLVKEKKAAYYKELANSLAGAADPANFWKRINQLKPKRPAQGIQLSLDILREHFEGLFNLQSEVALPAWVEPMICDPDLDAPFSIAELKAVIKSAKKGKAPGIDGIPYEFYQQAPDRFHEVLLQNVNKIFEAEKVPSSFAKALIFPLRKKLQADSVENVRGISFINAISKIVTGMVLARIVRRAEGGKNDINAGAKLRIFDGVLRSVMCYGAQVLGHKRNNHVEAAQFLFLRKMFGLSSSSPRHVILLESGRRPVYLFTLRIHAKYMGKVLFQHQGRLTHHIAREVLRRGVGWAKDWGNLASENGKVLEEEIGNIQSFKKLWEYLVGKVEVEEIKILEQRAGESKYHQWFLKNYRMSRGPHGYLDSQDFAGVRWCFKLRGELVHLNKKPWRTEEAQRCALCNLQEKEDTLHFMGTCPVLSEFRCRWLGKGRLQEEECLALLSSPDPKKLGGFCREAWSYRYSLITEFNY
ncbi:unnamed protein product [Nesidiocoris tenuis]|uniref:Reverse transcriptase domain-containing protein n=1 Tax=Nesidiocoris tenuis TaxID=355587 RepID=A0A6H5G0U3_9HEMI|nr:unnamed protein product [Nesidiocoris tenuis]